MSIEVSVICDTYNHEQYIRDALEGFVKQQTTFPFEVLIHDDASTDGTAAIIREYEEKYPDIIKPIYQKENLYSKDPGCISRLQRERAKGRYLALCEGDDYWTDPLKLQKQYDAMERNPQIDMCAHQSQVFDCRKGKITNFASPLRKTRIIMTEEVILGEGGLFPTNSLFYRKEIDNGTYAFRRNLPLDYTLQILGSLRGGILFLNEEMSVYRFLANGSWTSRTYNHLDRVIALYQKKQAMLDVLDEETAGKYSDVIAFRKLKSETVFLIDSEQYKKLRDPKYNRVLRSFPARKRAALYLKIYCPFLLDLKRSLLKRR